MANELRRIFKEGRSVVNGWSNIPSAFAAETMAQCGWDSITFDMQHGLIDYATLIHCLQALKGYPVVPLVRLPWNEPGIIGRVLDGGAMGVICPMVNNADEARALVNAARFPPLGVRSHGPIRAGTLYGQAGSYYKTANTDVFVFPMIETPDGMRNLDAILDVEGVDGVYVGPGDLGLTIGLPPILDRREPQILAFYDEIARKCRARGKIAGIHNATGSYSVETQRMGFQFLTILTDNGLLIRAASSEIATVREHLKEAEGVAVPA